MSKIFILEILTLILSSCGVNLHLTEVSGRVSCENDSITLVHPFVTRLSDKKTFVGDDNGNYSVKVQKGDSLIFSYVGLVSDTVPVLMKKLDVRLKPYIPGEDEYVYVDKANRLHTYLESYINTKDARIGVAVIINGRDTVSVNGTREFPMMSVFKFPLALAVAKWLDANSMTLDDYLAFGSNALNENTYSPMLKKYGKKNLYKLSVRELLEWSLIESDNNTTDILLKRIGGPGLAMIHLKDVAGDVDINIAASEEDMYNDNYLSYLNRSTPLAMATLFDRFYSEIKGRSNTFSEIASMLERCKTGEDRLPAPLKSTDAVIGHKTGTGWKKQDGRIMAINDCGYVKLPNGTNYSIAVFVADSAYDIDETSKLIAEISEIVYDELKSNR